MTDSRRANSETVLRSLVAITRRGIADATLSEFVLSPTDQSIILAIAERPGIRSIDIAKMFRLNRSTVSRQITALVQLGMVCENSADGGRGRPLALTDAGEEAFRGTLATLQAVIDAHLAQWSDNEVARFAHDLRRFDQAAND